MFLSAFIYIPIPAITFLVQRNGFDDMIMSIVQRLNCFITSYDRKLLILGLISIFKEKIKQEQLDKIAITCLDYSIQALHVQRMDEEIKFTNKQKMLKTKENRIPQKETLSQMEKEDICAYNLIKGKAYQLDQILEDSGNEDNGDDEILTYMVSDTREAERSVESILTPLKAVDEFKYFKDMIDQMKVLYCKFLGVL